MPSIFRLIAALSILCSIALADAPPATQPVDQEAKIAKDDLLDVGVMNFVAPQKMTSWLRRVDANGKITLPAVGTISLQGKSLADAVTEIQRALSDQHLIRNAAVTVSRKESGSAPSITCGPIVKGDYIECTIFDLVGPGRMTREILTVDENGEVFLPRAGKCKLVGQNESDAEKAVVKFYKDKRVVENAMVSLRRISEAEAKEAVDIDPKAK
jgi:protein involved in polysaccharide export with SLBB domain